MRVISKSRLVSVAMLIALPLGGAAMVPLGATASTPSSGVISGAAPTIWDFGPVEGVTGVSNVTGPVGQQCPPVLCDNYDLTVVLPQADTTFYATHTATMLIKYTWNSTLPTDMDIFAYAPDGTQSGPGNPDATSTGAGEEDLTLANPQSGLWHIRSLASTTPMPTSAHAVATLTFAAKGAPAAEPTVDFAHTAPMAFGPSTIVDPVFLSAEPQVNVERILPGSLPGAVDPKRIFVDWPLSTRTQTGQLHRSTDGGDSFRNLVDLTCAPRSRPNCITGGGGDTVARVNLIDGTVFFSDQEALANEALASSTDHGDSFPTARQSAVSNADTGVDRQWIAAVDAPAVTVGGAAAVPISGFLSYHIPGAGEYIQAINSTTGQPLPQPVTQLPLVGQSGPSRVDETGGPGTGWIYQSYRDFQGAQFQVGVAPVATYELPSAWKVNLVNTDSPLVFPWIALDSHGDLYAVWATNGNIYYAYSLIDDPLNNPLKGGTPATKWSHKWRVNPPGVGGSIFPEIVAGDPGRVAIVFFAAPGYVGDSSSSPATTAYNVYVAESVNGTDGNQPAMSVAQVNHRVAHLGNICTNGTTCVAQTSGQDRSLADMIDITTDQDGRASVIYTDNNSGLGNVADGTNLRSDPFAHFAKAVVGPSLFKGKPSINVPTAGTAIAGGRSITDPAGDATWPNTSGGTNLPGADLLGASLAFNAGQLTGTFTLADASATGMAAAITGYNNVIQAEPPAARAQYVLRFNTANDTCYMGMDVDSTGTPTFYDGVLDPNSKVTNGASTLAAAYRPGTGEIATSIVNNTVRITAKDALCGIKSGTPVYSVSAFSMMGPSDAQNTLIANTMRVIDATAPMDIVLGQNAVAASPSPVVVASPTPTVPPLPNTAGRVISAAGLGLILALLILGPLAFLRRRPAVRL